MEQILAGLTGWQAVTAMAVVGVFAGFRMWLGVKGELRKDREQETLGDWYSELIIQLRQELSRLKGDIETLIEENSRLRETNVRQQGEIDRLRMEIEMLKAERA